MADKTAELQAIADQIRKCTRCPLYKGATHAVPGEGPANAEIMMIGEGPGFNEDHQSLCDGTLVPECENYTHSRQGTALWKYDGRANVPSGSRIAQSKLETTVD